VASTTAARIVSARPTRGAADGAAARSGSGDGAGSSWQRVAGDVGHRARARPHAQARDDRQVVRRHARQTTAMDVEFLALELDVPVDAVEAEDRKPRRVGAAHPAHRRGELPAQAARDRAAVPLVEVAHHEARALAVGRLEEGGEQRHLVAALAKAQAEVTVEDVQRGVVDAQVHAQAAARLTPPAGEIAAQRAEHGQARQHRVAIGPCRAVGPGLPHHHRHAEARGQIVRLVGVRDAVLADHLLQADHVGLDLGDHGGDAVEITAAIEADTAMDVVAGDDEGRHAAS
jgi:hypothetical protein